MKGPRGTGVSPVNRGMAVPAMFCSSTGETPVLRFMGETPVLRFMAETDRLRFMAETDRLRFIGTQAMKSKTEYLTFDTKKHREYINITDRVADVVAESGIAEGMVLVSAMHITAGVFVNDAESGLLADIDDWLEGLAPFRKDYRHHRTGETNGDSHLKNLLIHHEVIVPITEGGLDLGPWQQIFYAEFDGQRPKRLVIKAIGE